MERRFGLSPDHPLALVGLLLLGIGLVELPGDPVAVDGTKLGPADLLALLNGLGGENGIGREDIVENRERLEHLGF